MCVCFGGAFNGGVKTLDPALCRPTLSLVGLPWPGPL